MSSAIHVRAICACALTLAFAASFARADIIITPPEAGSVNGANVDIVYAGSTSGVNVTVESTDEDSIGTINVEVTGPSNGWLTLTVLCDGSLFSITKDGDSTGELRLHTVNVELDIGAYGGSRGVIEADIVTNVIRADRNIYADIHISGASSGSFTNALNSLIVTLINLDEETDGSLLGNVIVGSSGGGVNGRIGSILVGNTIGRDPSLIRAKEIGSITAGFMTEVDVDLYTFGGTQTLGTLETTLGGWGGDEPSGGGGLTNGGILYADKITGDIDIKENFDAEISLGTAPHQNRRWRIGGSFMENGLIELPSGGLTHQVIVNRNDDGGEWEGVVQVGSGGGAIVLDGGAITDGKYTNTATSVGGGAVGLATYRLHDSSCGPANNGYFFASQLELVGIDLECVPTNGIYLHFYGPLNLSEDDVHVKVEKYIDTDWFAQSGFESSLVSGSHSRRLWVRPDSGGGAWWNDLGEYRITPLSGRLKSSDVVDTPNVANFTYLVTVVDGCELMLLQNFDFNDDQTLCELDFLAWSSDPCDLNGDNVVDCDDIAVMLSAVDLYETLTAE